jgi:Ca-activated chloride channel homolog
MSRLRRRFVTLVAISLLLAPLGARAQDNRAPADKTLSPYFFVEDGDASIDRLPLKDTRVDVAIAGVIADVTVTQVYENRGPRPIHARYVFPASTRAAVSGLTMTVGAVRTVAKIRERERAAQEFAAAKRAGKSATLLEQSRPNVFTMKLANVLPGDTIVVELKYTELLVPTDGLYEFVYPTVVGPRYSRTSERNASPADAFVGTPYTQQDAAPVTDFHLAGVVSTGLPFQEMVSPTHQMTVRSTGAGRAEIALADTERFAGNRDFILRYRLAGREIAAGLLLYRGGDENFFLLIAEPPDVVAPDQIPSREYVFVLDVSGSMNGFPLETAKKLMRDLANVLRPTDRFNVVLFADGAALFSPTSVAATQTNLERALRFVGRRDVGGGTELLAALQRAVAIPRQSGVSRSVVLVTDGYIEAESDVFDYVRGRLDDENFFAFGIGSSVNRFLIEGVARAGRGEPFIVTEPGEAEAAADRLRRYIETPVLTGINVNFRGFDAYDVEPAQVPDLFASRPIVMFGKWRGEIGGSVDITGTTGAGVYQTSIAVTSTDSDSRHEALRQLWARTRIAELSDFGPNEPRADRVAAITSLGLTYSLLTRYTSFVAVQEVVRTSEPGADVNQPLPMPRGVSDLAVGVTNGPEPELAWVLALVVALMAAVAAVRFRLTAWSVGSGFSRT